MGSLNKAIIIGRVGRDPEIRSMGDKSIARFSVATSETWTDKRDERQEKTEWHRIVVFQEHTVGFVENHVRKGDLVCVEGQIQSRTYEKDGTDHTTTEIVVSRGRVEMLSKKDDQREEKKVVPLPPRARPRALPSRRDDVDDSEIPF